MTRTVSQTNRARKKGRQCSHTDVYCALAAAIVVGAWISVSTELAGVLAREALVELVKAAIQLAVAGR